LNAFEVALREDPVVENEEGWTLKRCEALVRERRTRKGALVDTKAHHAGTTIVPLLSQVEPSVKFDDAERDALTHRIMFGGDEVVKAKAGGGSATLSMAYAGAEMANSVMRALDGEKGVTECTFVESTVTDAKFFSSPVTLGKEGVDTVHGYGTVNDYEKKLIADMLPDLKAQAEKGFEWAKANAK